MKVLVTGCAGFIGSHCVERLLEQGHQVIGLDNFSRFYAKQIKQGNLSNFIEHPAFTFHEIDIRDADKLNELVYEPVDLVLHLAAKAGVRPSIEHPNDYIDVNIKGTHHILQWMVKHSVKKMFFASSSSVYGNREGTTAFKEDELHDKPISPYAFSKRSGELLNYNYHHLYKLDIINARFFTVYGPRQRPDLAIHKFMKLIDAGEPIQMFGDGSTARDYTFVEDTVNGIMAGIQHLMKNDLVYEIVNLGNQHPVKLSRLIDLIYETMGSEKQVQQTGMQAGDVDVTYADISRANGLFGYNPQVSIEEGIKRFYAWFKEQKS